MSDGGHERLDDFERFIKNYADVLLAPYLARIADIAEGSISKKEINDPVWGTLSLDPHEILVLDSPLVQRLQRIKQLGVAHFVYPTARHSRLEHSLGVMHQVSRILDTVSAGDATTDLSPKLRKTLRMAGLCHDLGHGAMSHVLESAVNFSSVNRLRLDFSDKNDLDSSRQLSEIAAFFMVRSDGFKKLLELALENAKLHRSEISADDVANAIISKSFDKRVPMAHELLSGPFDADKMDYMARDAQMTGVPVVTDFNRLIQKLRAAKKPSSDMPPEIAKTLAKDVQVTVIGVTPTGRRALDEMALGRALMFDKVYRHHKVRATETMVKALVNAGLKHVREHVEQAPYAFHDEQLLDLTVDQLSQMSDSSPSDDVLADFKSAEDISTRLRDRNLFVRAYAFGVTSGNNNESIEGNGSDRMDQLLRDVSGHDENEALVKDIAAETIEMARTIKDTKFIEEHGDSQVWHYIKVDPPRAGEISADASASRTFVIGQAETPFDGTIIIGTQAWAEAYTNVRNLGYVFSPREIASLVSVASEAIIARRNGVEPHSGPSVGSKQDSASIQEIKTKLQAAGYKSDNADFLKPEVERLTRADIPTKLKLLSGTFTGYSPPALDGSAASEEGITVDRLQDWLRQFPNDLIDPALILLQNIKVMSRVEATRAIRTFQTRFPEFGNFVAVPLGSAKDGSAVVAYNSGDYKYASGKPLSVLSFDEALNADRPILFVDDFVGRGSSSTSILDGWLGYPERMTLREERLPLSPENQQRLKDREIGFSFITGLDEGEKALNDELAWLGFEPRVSVRLKEAEVPTFESVAAEHPTEDWEGLKEFLSNVGRQVLDDGTHDDTWITKRTFGYGNLGKLLISTFNTPTVTISALWKQGIVDGKDWDPIIPRRKKL